MFLPSFSGVNMPDGDAFVQPFCAQGQATRQRPKTTPQDSGPTIEAVPAKELQQDGGHAQVVPQPQKNKKALLYLEVKRILEDNKALSSMRADAAMAGISLDGLAKFISGFGGETLNIYISAETYETVEGRHAIVAKFVGEKGKDGHFDTIMAVLSRELPDLLPKRPKGAQAFLEPDFNGKESDFKKDGSGLVPDPNDSSRGYFTLIRSVSGDEIERRIAGSKALQAILGAVAVPKPQAQSKLDAANERTQAEDRATDIINGSSRLYMYSNWNNLKDYIELAEELDRDIKTLSKDYDSLSEYSANRVYEVLRNLSNAGFFQLPSKLDAKTLGGITALDFATRVANNVVAINVSDQMHRDFVFGGRFSDSGQAVVGAFADTSEAGLLNRQRQQIGNDEAADYAVRVLYGDLSNAPDIINKLADLGGKNKGGRFEPDGWDSMSPSERLYSLYAQTAAMPGAFKTAYSNANNINTDAASQLVTAGAKGVALISTAEEHLTAVIPEMNGSKYISYRNPYNMLEIAAGLSLLNSPEDAPFVGINYQSAPDLTMAVDYITDLKSQFEAVKSVISKATGGIYSSEAAFTAEFEPVENLFRRSYERLATLRGIGTEQDAAMSALVKAYYDLNGADFIYKQATESDQTRSKLASLLTNFETSMQSVANTAYGANPARDMLLLGASMPQGSMSPLLANPGMWKAIYPDATVIDLGTRNQIARQAMNMASQLFTTSLPFDRYSILASYASGIAGLNLGTTNLLSSLTQRTFGITQGGVIYIKSPLNQIISPLYTSYDSNVFQMWRAQMNQLYYGQRDLTYPLESITMPQESYIPRRLASNAQIQQRFRDGDWDQISLREYFVKPVSAEYSSNINLAFSQLNTLYNNLLQRNTISAGPWAIDVAAAQKDRLELSRGATAIVEKSNSPSSSMSLKANANTTKGPTYDEEQLQGILTSQNFLDWGNTILRQLNVNGNYKNRSSAGEPLKAGLRWESIDEYLNAELNGSPYRNSDVLVHYNHTKKAATTDSQQVGTSTTSGTGFDNLNAYYRIYGTMWVQLILTDDQRKAITETMSSKLGTAERAQNSLVAMGTPYSSVVQATGAYEQVKTTSQTFPQSAQAAVHEGLFAGISFFNKVGATFGKTIDDEKAGRAEYFRLTGKNLPIQVSVGYYQLLSSRVRVLDNTMYANDYTNEYIRAGYKSRKAEPKTEMAQVQVVLPFFGTADILKATALTSLYRDDKGKLQPTKMPWENGGMAAGSFEYQDNVDPKAAKVTMRNYGLFTWAYGEDELGKPIVDAKGRPTSALRSAIVGTESKFAQFPLIFTQVPLTVISQWQKYALTGNERYSNAVRTDFGEVQFEANGTWHNHQYARFQDSLYQFGPRIEALASAAKAYADTYNDAKLKGDERRDRYLADKMGKMTDAMDSLFLSADQYSLLADIASGKISDVTIKMRNKSGGWGTAFTASFGKDADGNKTVLASLVNFQTGSKSGASDVAVVLIADTRDKFFKSMKMNGGGVMVKGPQWKVAALATTVTKSEAQAALSEANKSSREIGAQVMGSYKDVMLDVTRASDLWRVNLMYGGQDVQMMFNFTEVAKQFKSFGAMGAYYQNQWRYAIEAGFAAFNNMQKYQRANAAIEIGKMSSILSTPSYLGGGLRYEQTWGAGRLNSDWTIYMKLVGYF